MNSPQHPAVKPPRFGELVRRRFGIGETAINYCLHEQRITGERLGEVLERCGFLSNEQVLEIVAEQSGLPFVEDAAPMPKPELLGLFNAVICRRQQFFPLEIRDDRVRVAAAGSDLDGIAQTVRRLSGRGAELVLAPRRTVQRWIRERFTYAETPVEERLRREIARISSDRDSALSLDALLDALLAQAVSQRASDIHLRPTSHSINVAFRVDGVVRSVTSLEVTFTRLTSTIKLHAGMDIADMRSPQDGSFERNVFDEPFDIRVSTVVTPDGESVVLRLLPRNTEVQRLEDLGFLPEHVEIIREVFQRPAGVFLMTGPTGSGKTTTLHAGLRSLDLLSRNVVTVEEPVEYRLSLIRQTETNPRAGYSFGNAVRHFLRHDPDVIVVGEVRDRETADSVIMAAETGHLVLSTMHTNSALGVVGRLQSLGVARHIVADSLLGAMAQRLVRTLCVHCREEVEVSAVQRGRHGLHAVSSLWEARGCARCDNTGYRGRTPLYECVVLDHALASAVHRQAPLHELRMIAREAGAIMLEDVALQKLRAGQTTFEEVCYFLQP